MIYEIVAQTVELIATKIRRLRGFKQLSQKEVCGDSNLQQCQYSYVENGKLELCISTLEKLTSTFAVEITEFFKAGDLEQGINLHLIQKTPLIDKLTSYAQQPLLKIIELALSDKQTQDKSQTLIAQSYVHVQNSFT